MEDIIEHYDSLIDEDNDPARDPKSLQEHMDKWDGEAFIDALQLTPDKTVLEIGVGTGRLALRVCGKCKEFVGVDISPKTIKRAKENLQNYKNVQLICGDFMNLDSNLKFDVIYSSLTFLHVKDKASAVRKVAAMLKTGGLFVVSIEKSKKTTLEYGSRVLEIYPISLQDLTAILTKAGLEIESRFETEYAIIFAAVKY